MLRYDPLLLDHVKVVVAHNGCGAPSAPPTNATTTTHIEPHKTFLLKTKVVFGLEVTKLLLKTMGMHYVFISLVHVAGAHSVLAASDRAALSSPGHDTGRIDKQ